MRLAGVSALLTFVILCGFAIAVGSLTVRRIRSDFNRQVAETAAQLPSQLSIEVTAHVPDRRHRPAAEDLAEPEDARDQDPLARRRRHRRDPRSALARSRLARAAQRRRLPRAQPPGRSSTSPAPANASARCIVQYGRSVADTEATVTRVELFLLSACSRHWARAVRGHDDRAPRDGADRAADDDRGGDRPHPRPLARMPQSEAEDEVSELARTLRGHAPRARRRARRDRGDARAPAPLRRRRLARAAHAADERARQPRAAGRIAARRPGRRGALGPALLPAHAPAGRRPAAARAHRRRRAWSRASRASSPRSSSRRPPSSGRSAASTRSRSTSTGRPSSRARATNCTGSTINLLENALRHTPPGTEIRVSTRHEGRRRGALIVEDDGPGVARARANALRALRPRRRRPRRLLRPRPRDRQRGRRDSTAARLDRAPANATARPTARASSRALLRRRRQTSTTTGSTIGRRLRRS